MLILKLKTFVGSYIWKIRFSWWSSGRESACQCRGHRFSSWYRKISHAAEPLSLWATATEVHAPRAVTGEPTTTRSLHDAYRLRGPAAHHLKADKQARLVERKVCLISDAGIWGWGWGATCRNSTVMSVILELVSGGLTHVILIVLGIVNLQFQGPIVSISLRPVLRIVAADVMGTVWSSCS